MPLAFAPFGLFPIAFVALAVLFLAWRADQRPRRALLRGWLFGVGAFGVGTSWIFESFAFSNTPAILTPVLGAGFVGCLALYPAVLGWVVTRLSPAGTAPRLLAVYPAAWTLCEWFRGWAFTGFTWLHVGYSQIDNPASGWFPIIGVYGTGAVVAFTAGGLAYAFLRRDRSTWIVLGGIAVLWGAGAALARIEWGEPAGRPIAVAIVQGNVPQDQKWRPEMRAPTLERYVRLTRQHFDADLVVWPETAMPGYLDTLRVFTQRLAVEAVEHGSAILAGVPIRDVSGGRRLNGLVMLGPESGIYHKRHLVPFGEYLPLAPLLRPIVEASGIRLADFSSGALEQAPLRVGAHVLGVSICYEIAFGDAVRRDLPDAALLVTVSNDAWFGRSLGPHQHLEIARVRAAETGRWLVRATNTGLSAIVSPHGAVVARLPSFEVAAGTFKVIPIRGATPYVRFGDTPIVAALAIWLGMGIVWARRTARSGILTV